MIFVFLCWLLLVWQSLGHPCCCKCHSFSLLWLGNIPLYICATSWSFICQWTSRLSPCLGCCESCCCERRGVYIFLDYSSVWTYGRILVSLSPQHCLHVWNQSHWAKPRCWQDWFLLEAQGKNPFLASSRFWKGLAFLSLGPQKSDLCLHHHKAYSLTLTPPVSLFKGTLQLY